MGQENSFDYFFINFLRSLHDCERELSLPQECPFRTDQMQVQSLRISLLPSPKCFPRRIVHHSSEEHTIRLNIPANLRRQCDVILVGGALRQLREHIRGEMAGYL